MEIGLRLRETKEKSPVNMLASSLSTRVPSLVEMQVKCKGSTSRSPVNAVKLPSAAAQLLTLPFPVNSDMLHFMFMSGEC